MAEFITEGRARISIPRFNKISKEMPVFYNPVMKFNRDISILLLNSIDKKGMRIASPLAASGIRGIRFLLELKKNKIKEIHFNDYSSSFKKTIANNLKLNKINPKSKRIKLHNTEANLFLLKSAGFDYIDIDPFGSPNPFLESSARRISRQGIIAITATDTSALCGTYPAACIRKYWAAPLRNELMHETGLRILIRKAQLIGAQYEKALTPIFSYSKDHYMRVFLKCKKGRGKADELLKQHKMSGNAGPMWAGKLWDDKLAGIMLKNNKMPENEKFLRIISEESKIGAAGFYDLHKITQRHKIRRIPKKSDLIKSIKKLGYKASETHFNPEAVRSDIPLEKLLRLMAKG